MKKWLLFLSLFSGLVFDTWSAEATQESMGSDGSLIVILDEYNEDPLNTNLYPMGNKFFSSLAQSKASIIVSENIVKSVFFKLKIFNDLAKVDKELKDKAEKALKGYVTPSEGSRIQSIIDLKQRLLADNQKTKEDNEKFLGFSIPEDASLDLSYSEKMMEEHKLHHFGLEGVHKLIKTIVRLNKEIKEDEKSLAYEIQVKRELEEMEKMGISYINIHKFYTLNFKFDSWAIFKIKNQKGFIFIPQNQKVIADTLAHNASLYQRVASLPELYDYLDIKKTGSYNPFVKIKDYLGLNAESHNPFVQIRDYLSSLKHLDKEWSILLSGHGSPLGANLSQTRIAGTDGHNIKNILTFLATEVNTKILYYSTCYGGGKVGEFISNHMQKTENPAGMWSALKGYLFKQKKARLFPIVSATFLDSSSKGALKSAPMTEFFNFLSPLKQKELTYDNVAHAALKLYPMVGTCPSFYNEDSLKIFPAVLMPQEENFRPLILCDALKVLTHEQEGSVETDAQTRVLLCNANMIPYNITFKQSVPKILSYGSGDTDIDFVDIKVDPSLQVSFTNFILKAFFHTIIHYSHTYTIYELTAWVGPNDHNYEILKPFLNQDGVISLSHVFIKYNTVDERTFNINSSISFKVSKDGDVTEFESINKNRPERDFSEPFTLQIK